MKLAVDFNPCRSQKLRRKAESLFLFFDDGPQSFDFDPRQSSCLSVVASIVGVKWQVINPLSQLLLHTFNAERIV